MAESLTWQDKFSAMQALDPDISIKMSSTIDGQWYVCSSIVYSKNNNREVWNTINFLASSIDLAICRSWEAITSAGVIVKIDKVDLYGTNALVTNVFQWKKFMWVRV